MKPEVEPGLQQDQADKDTTAAEGSKATYSSDGDITLETKLADEICLRRFTEDVLDSRQQEIESQESEKGQLASELDYLKRELADTQRQLAEARFQSKAKTKQLEEAKDQIFRLQPRRRDITESEAKDGYKSLCNNVQRWVENRLRAILDDLDLGRLKARPVPPQTTRFLALVREPAKRCLAVDQSDEFHVMAAIMNYLCLVLFSKSFYCPLDDSDADRTLIWIDEVEKTMTRLPRDVSHCREWRSETLTALTHQPAFKARRARYIQLVTEDLMSLLAALVPKVPPEEFAESIRRSILEPAADLAHQLQLTPSIFSLKWPTRSASTRLEVYECLNVVNGMMLPLGGTTPSSPIRRKTTYLFDVAPGLFVERIENGKKLGSKAIAKPIVLVHNGDGGISQKSTVVKWLWDATGGPRPAHRTTTSKRSAAGAPAPAKRG